VLGWEPKILLQEGMIPTYRWINARMHGEEDTSWTPLAAVANG
jgi:hypothetical protein